MGGGDSGWTVYIYDYSLYVVQYSGSNIGYVKHSNISSDWHHLLVIYDNVPAEGEKSARVIIDGVQVGSFEGFPLTASSAPSDISIGALAGSCKVHTGAVLAGSPVTGYFKGSISKLRIWNRVLDAAEIGDLYKKGDTLPEVLFRPGSVTVDKSGNLYVADKGNGSIKKFDIAGVYQNTLGEYGTGSGKFMSISGLASDSNGNIYATDAANNHLQKFNDLGFIAAVYGTATEPFHHLAAVTADGNGKVYISDQRYGNAPYADKIRVFNASLNFLQEFTGFTTLSGSELFGRPQGIAIDSKGSILVVNSSDNKLVKLSPEGVTEFVLTGGLWSFSNGVSLSTDAEDRCYLSTGAGELLRLRFPEELKYIIVPSGTDDVTETTFVPYDIETDHQGSLIISDTQSHRILKLKQDGTLLKTIGSFGSSAGKLNEPRGLGLDEAGNIYVADAVNNRIQKFDNAGEFLALWNSSDFTSPSITLSQPSAVCIDAYGKVYVCNTTADEVVKYDAMQGIGAAIQHMLGISLSDIYMLDAREQAGQPISTDLAALHIDIGAYRYLLELAGIVQSKVLLQESQTEELYHLLVNAYKQGQYGVWKAKEQDLGITLSPDHFRLRTRAEEQILSFIPWRSSSKRRKAWRDVLAARIEQQDLLWQGHKDMLKDAEDNVLNRLRDTFIMAAGFKGSSLEEKAAEGSRKLMIDLKNNCCLRTTRISQALEGLQGIMWSVRNGLLQDTYPDLFITPDINFDEEWSWMGSYSSWRAAQFVFMYPENILLPSYGKRSSMFDNIVKDIRNNISITPLSAHDYAQAYIDYYNEIRTIKIQYQTGVIATTYLQKKNNGDYSRVMKNLCYMIGATPAGKLFWSTLDMDSREFYNEWTLVPGLEDQKNIKVTGWVPVNYVKDQNHKIFLMFRPEDRNDVIKYISFSSKKHEWDTQIGEIKLEHPYFILPGERQEIFFNYTSDPYVINPDKRPDSVMDFLTYGYGVYPPNDSEGIKMFRFKLDENLKVKTDSYYWGELFNSRVQIKGYMNWRTLHISYWYSHATAYIGDVPEYRAGSPGRLEHNTFALTEYYNHPEMNNVIGMFTSDKIFAKVGDVIFSSPANTYSVYYIVTTAKYISPGVEERKVGVWKKMFDANGPVTRFRVIYHAGSLWAFYDERGKMYMARVNYTRPVVAGNETDFEFSLDQNSRLPLDISGSYDIRPYVLEQSSIDSMRQRNKPAYADALNKTNYLLQMEKEYQYLLPVQIALALQKRGYYQYALDWFRQVYDYTQSSRLRRSVYYGLYDEQHGTVLEDFENSNDLKAQGYSSLLTTADNPLRAGNNSAKVGSFVHNVPNFAYASFIYHLPAGLDVNWDYPQFTMDIAEADANKNTTDTVIYLVPRKFSRIVPGVADVSNNIGAYAATCYVNNKGIWQTLRFQRSYAIATGNLKPEEVDCIEIYIGYNQVKPGNVFYIDNLRFGKVRKTIQRDEEWIKDPLNPHAIAEKRPSAHLRFVVMSIVKCMLEYADSEFTMDNAESVPRARQLYEAALELLESEGMSSYADQCMARADAELSSITFPAPWNDVWKQILKDVYHVKKKEDLASLIGDIKEIYFDDALDVDDKLRVMRNTVNVAIENAVAYRNVHEELKSGAGTLNDVYASLLSDRDLRKLIDSRASDISDRFLALVEQTTGVKKEVLLSDKAFEDDSVMASLRNTAMSVDYNLISADQITGSRDDIDEKFLNDADFDFSAGSEDRNNLKLFLLKDLKQTLAAYTSYDISYKPSASFTFCIPPNPMLTAFRLQAELNLYKIRNCMNIAGVVRDLEPFAAPTDAVSGLPLIGSAGTLQLPGDTVFRPTIYRYQTLIERSKQLTQIAQQVESSMLSALEKLDAEKYSLLKAKQDLNLAKSSIRLQDLRMQEAKSNTRLTELQKERAQLYRDHYDELLNNAMAFETLSLSFYSAALIYLDAAVTIGIATDTANAAKFWSQSSLNSINFGIELLQTNAAYFQRLADIERRNQEWEFQRTMGDKDIEIADQQIRIAQDQEKVVGQEREIAVMQTDNAEATIDFLNSKFSNAELYDWMGGILQGVYRFFLQQATSMAKTAYNQLAFERQELPPDYIKSDYWQAPSDNLTINGSNADGSKTVDRKGLTGAERLLQDIYQLDQYAFTTDKRKLELTKTISLASLSPVEFQRFRETGELIFETSMENFNRDFPGHYLRLIRRVKVSVVALIPPTEGIKATLTNTGLSYVVVQGAGFQKVKVKREPEMVALTGTANATGMFELSQVGNDKLLPFENTGVEGNWVFQLPKASNFFDYGTIADVLLTFEYTALYSDIYRKQVEDELGTDYRAARAFSFKNHFADQWYDLCNPELTATPGEVSFSTSASDFPTGLTGMKITQLGMYFLKADEVTDEADLKEISQAEVAGLVFTPSAGQKGFFAAAIGEKGTGRRFTTNARAVNGIISSASISGSNWTAFTGAGTDGRWKLVFDGAFLDYFRKGKVADIIFMVSYTAEAPAWLK